MPKSITPLENVAVRMNFAAASALSLRWRSKATIVAKGTEAISKAEEEQEEVAGAHHHEHTQQGAHREHIELALADAALIPRDPGLAHQDNDERA